MMMNFHSAHPPHLEPEERWPLSTIVSTTGGSHIGVMVEVEDCGLVFTSVVDADRNLVGPVRQNFFWSGPDGVGPDQSDRASTSGSPIAPCHPMILVLFDHTNS